MTYKARERILAAGLVPFEPKLDPDESAIRDLFVTPALHAWLYETDRKKTADYKAKIRAHLGHFVKGKLIDNRDFMKHLQGDIWEVRIQLQKYSEATRIFGAFAAADIFVALHRKMRNELGRYEDERWKAAIKKTDQAWSDQLAEMPRVCSWPFSNCVTSNADDMGDFGCRP